MIIPEKLGGNSDYRDQLARRLVSSEVRTDLDRASLQQGGNRALLELIQNRKYGVLELTYAVNLMIPEAVGPNGDGAVIKEMIPATKKDIKYGERGETGLIFETTETQRNFDVLGDDEVLMVPLYISLCGTDLNLMRQLKNDLLGNQARGKIVGHEAAGIIVGAGKNVKERIGEVVCLDSHGSCEIVEHESFDDCVGLGCDQIAGGIKGALKLDHERLPEGQQRDPAPDGFWTNLIIVDKGFLPLSIPPELLSIKDYPFSTLESSGNVYNIIGAMQDLGIISEVNDPLPKNTLLVVVGLGATGGPLAIAGSFRNGCQIIGIEPIEQKRALVEDKIENCLGTFTNVNAAQEFISENTSPETNVVIAVMTGNEAALTDSVELLRGLPVQVEKKVAIVFGLFPPAIEEKEDILMPFIIDSIAPFDQPISQRSFVFNKERMILPGENGEVLIQAANGRTMKDWHHLFFDLTNQMELADKLKQNVSVIKGLDSLTMMMDLMNSENGISALLRRDETLKLAAEVWPGILNQLTSQAQY